MSVPSNLVPTRILQLPEDPSPSDTGWMMYVNNGVTYKVQVNAVLNVSGVPGTRTVTAGTGLTGGGALSSNITISVAPGGIGASQLNNTGVTPGVYGDPANYPVLTIDANGRVTAATELSFSSLVFNPLIIGAGLSGALYNGSSPVTIAIDSTVATLTGTQTLSNKTLASPLVTSTLELNAAGVSSYTPFSYSVVSMAADSNNFTTAYGINLNSGTDASFDFVAYNDASDVNSYFIDMGMNSSNYSSAVYPIFTPNSGYLLTGGGTSGQASDLFIGTTNAASDLKLFTGGVLTSSVKATIKGNTGNFLLGTTTDTGYMLNVAGTSYLGGAATFGSTVTLNANPTLALQAATKQYVDSAVSSGFTVKASVRLATTAALAANTYNNGTLGVGATLTANANGALSIDGVAVATSDRVLVKDEVASANNGSYSVTATGSAGTPYILTRTTDFDQAGAGEIANNSYFFVSAGNALSGSSWVLSQIATITVGTTPLTFTNFSSSQSYTGGTNIDVAGQVISLTGAVAATNGGTGVSTVTTGDLLYGSAANTWSKLPLGIAYKSLTVNASGTQLEWNAINLSSAAAVAGTLPVSFGGTGTTTSTGTGNVVLSTGATLNSPAVSNYEDFTPSTAPTYAEGRVWYDSTEKALAFYNDSSALAVHLAQDLIVKVINNTGSTIANGSPVYVTGTSSGQTYPNIALARADVAATASVIGLTNGSIANGAFGYVTSQGIIDNVNTSAFTVGQVLYLSPYSAGQLMNTIPPTGITVQVGVVTFVNSSTGHIYVKQTTPLAVPASIITGVLPVAHGGTSFSTYTAGDIIYSSATDTLSKLSVGTTGQVLTVSGGVPAWAEVPSSMVYPGAGIPNSTGSAWGTSYGTTGTGSVVLSDSPTFTTTITSTGALQLTGSDTVTQNIATNQTSGNLTIGGTAQTTGTIAIGGSNAATGTITLGRSTGAQTVNIATGAAAGGVTKTVNIGTQGTSSSTTNITIGNNTTGGGTLTFGQATGSQTTNIQAGATASGSTKTISIGTGGLSGSTTSITIGSTTGTSTTTVNGILSATSRAGVLAANSGLTANTTVTNTTTYTTGGVTLASQTAAAGSVWRVRAYGQFTAASSATARNAQIACFWGTGVTTAISVPVLTSTAQTTQWQVEFELTATTTTAIWTTGTLISRISSATALAMDNVAPASTTVSSGAQTLDLRVAMSTSVSGDSWIIQQVTMERLE